MEAEIREILTLAVADDASRADLFSALMDRFGRPGGEHVDPWPEPGG